MGLVASWTAVKPCRKAEVFARLGLVDLAEPVPFQLSSPAYLDLGEDWLAVVARFPGREVMERLSEAGWALACIVDEVSRFSLAQGYQRGQPCWSVMYEEGRVPDLEALGSPPRDFMAVVDELMEEAASDRRAGRSTDAPFRIPIELAWRECGFWPDADRMAAPSMTRLQAARRPTSLRRRMAAVNSLFGR